MSERIRILFLDLPLPMLLECIDAWEGHVRSMYASVPDLDMTLAPKDTLESVEGDAFLVLVCDVHGLVRAQQAAPRIRARSIIVPVGAAAPEDEMEHLQLVATGGFAGGYPTIPGGRRALIKFIARADIYSVAWEEIGVVEHSDSRRVNGYKYTAILCTHIVAYPEQVRRVLGADWNVGWLPKYVSSVEKTRG